MTTNSIIVQEKEDSIITRLREWKTNDEAFAYAQSVEMGRTCQRNQDQARWIIGDLACFVETEYGENRLSQFADDINVPFERVEEYRTMCRFWEFPVRAEFSELSTVTYSHMRVAKAFKDVETARSFLLECVENAWTVRDARMEANRRLGKVTEVKEVQEQKRKETPLLVTEAYVTSFTRNAITLNATDTRGLQAGMRYRVEVFPILDEED